MEIKTRSEAFSYMRPCIFLKVNILVIFLRLNYFMHTRAKEEEQKCKSIHTKTHNSVDIQFVVWDLVSFHIFLH